MLLIFFILNICCLILNIVNYISKKKGFSVTSLKLLIYVLFVVLLALFTFEIFSFLILEPESVLNSFNENIIQISIFNLSISFFGISIIFFFAGYIRIKNRIIKLNSPPFFNARKGSIKIGKVVKQSSKNYNFLLSLKDLEKHMFVCGSTGTGKSNFLQNFLINFTKLYDIPFFLVEFKGEYHFLQQKIRNTLILWPGENFSINIFNPENSNPLIHAERIFDILKSGKFLDENANFSPQMEKVLVEILIRVCENQNLQNWDGFFKLCEDYLQKNEASVPMLKQTLISIRNRIRRFSNGPLRKIFESANQISINQIFSMNVLLDLSSIIRLGGEKEDALFFLNMILKYLWDLNLTVGADKYNGIKHLTIIEDAQYFAPQDLSKKLKITSYLEDIALLQRGTGECLISLATRPNISNEILANCGVFISFQSHLQKDLMQELLNLEETEKNFISALDEGICIVRINSVKEPFLLWVPLIKRNKITVSEIQKNNKLILKNFQNFRMKEKKSRKINFLKSLESKKFGDLQNYNFNSYSNKQLSEYATLQQYIKNLYEIQKKNK
ncbi:MAG: ATP-binding protein [Candidatus Heimdallarchaeota archaeon]